MSKAKVQHSSSGFMKWVTPRLNDNKLTTTEEEKESDDAIRAAAFEEAYKTGYEAGKQQAVREVAEKISLLNAYIAAMSRPFSEQNQQLAEQLANLAGKIAKNLVLSELKADPQITMTLIKDCVATLSDSTLQINIHLNPENARTIREMIATNNTEQNWNIIDDPLIAQGDFKVSSKDSLIDANLEARVNLIISQFFEDGNHELAP